MIMADPSNIADSTNGFVVLFAVVLGGGLAAGLAKLWNARTASRKLDMDHDPNSPRVAIGGAETAVATMDRALKGLQDENARQAKRIEKQDERIAHLEKENADLRQEIEQIRERIGLPTDPRPAT